MSQPKKDDVSKWSNWRATFPGRLPSVDSEVSGVINLKRDVYILGVSWRFEGRTPKGWVVDIHADDRLVTRIPVGDMQYGEVSVEPLVVSHGVSLTARVHYTLDEDYYPTCYSNRVKGRKYSIEVNGLRLRTDDYDTLTTDWLWKRTKEPSEKVAEWQEDHA